MEIISEVKRRRRWRIEDKLRILAVVVPMISHRESPYFVAVGIDHRVHLAPNPPPTAEGAPLPSRSP